MSKFELVKREKKSDPSDIIVEGSFLCQRCDECVDEAKLFFGDGIIWKCSKGHASKANV